MVGLVNVFQNVIRDIETPLYQNRVGTLWQDRSEDGVWDYKYFFDYNNTFLSGGFDYGILQVVDLKRQPTNFP